MFAFVAEGTVVSLIVRAVGRGEQLTVGVKSDADVLWTTTMRFEAGEVAEGGKVQSATVDGSEVTIGSRVKVAGVIAFYDSKQAKGQRNKAFNLTKVAVLEAAAGDAVDALLSDLAF
jgi:ABC-type tungstate transport system permease subunit